MQVYFIGSVCLNNPHLHCHEIKGPKIFSQNKPFNLGFPVLKSIVYGSDI